MTDLHPSSAPPAEPGSSAPQPQNRQTKPHRGNLLRTLGIVGLISSLILWPVGLILSLIVVILAIIDLQEIRHGSMDPSGNGMTQTALICGVIGVVLGIIGMVLAQTVLKPIIDDYMRRNGLQNQGGFR
jgi:hypothetical protein